ncbi:MAG: hypothetical protein JRE64_02320 [Deltaproteobacteria bacterium]|nr:hypothetical protein [Deltaproteobacteria bacterium]
MNKKLSIDQITEIDDCVFKIIEKDAEKVFLSFKNNNLEKTGQALSLFHVKIGFIKNGIYDQIEHNNLYSANILYRTLIEHYLKAQFILLESLKDGNDNIGKEYYQFADASEKLQLGSAYKRAGEILFPEKTFDDVFEVLKEMFPEFKEYSKKEIRNNTAKFNYRQIVEALYDLFYVQQNTQGNGNNFLVNLIPEYSDLSSYVHGGPAADKSILNLSKIGLSAVEDQIIEVFYKTIMLSTHFNSLLYMFALKFDENYKKVFINIQSELDKLMKLKQKS